MKIMNDLQTPNTNTKSTQVTIYLSEQCNRQTACVEPIPAKHLYTYSPALQQILKRSVFKYKTK